MPKYDMDMGDPFDMIAEECAEVIQACMKARRFGMDGTQYRRDHNLPSPKDQITQEIGDVLVVIGILIQRGLIDGFAVEAAKYKKRERLEELFGKMEWTRNRSGDGPDF